MGDQDIIHEHLDDEDLLNQLHPGDQDELAAENIDRIAELQDDEDLLVQFHQENVQEDQNDINEEPDNVPDQEEEQGNNAHDARPTRKPSLKELVNGPYSEPVLAQVNVSRADLLYMALGSAKQNHFTNKAFNDSVQLLNNVFSESVLPVSSARLDSLLMDKSGVRYIFFCKSCFWCFGEFVDYKKIVTKDCPECNTVNAISNLSEANYFVMFDMRQAIENLLNKEEVRQALLKPADAAESHQPGFLRDVYDGSMYRTFVEKVSDFVGWVLSLILCVDGAPLFKSSLMSIWPILFVINELPPKIRMRNVLLGGLWFGKCQPPMDLLLDPLVDHLKDLSNGFHIEVGNDQWHLKAFVTGCCCDSGARYAVQGVKKHGGYCACNWCCIVGTYQGRHVRYPMTETVPIPRNHETLVQQQINLQEGEESLQSDSDESEPASEHNYGVKSVSPLINAPLFDMVNGFIVEPMHLLHLGVTKTHLLKWVEDQGDFSIKAFIDVINDRIRSLTPPLEFRRMPRTLDEKVRWKARELENWLLFCCIPVLTGILPNKYLKLWLLFAQAVYLLSLVAVTHENVNSADALLKHFLCLSQEYYGDVFMVFNMHLLTHLAEHVARWGPLWAASAYCFESFNGYLLKVIHSQAGIPNQVIRAISWQQSLLMLEPHVSDKARQYVRTLPKQKVRGMEVDGCILYGVASSFTPSNEEKWVCERMGIDLQSCEQYEKLMRNDCIFSMKPMARTNNTVAQLYDNRFVLIKKILFERKCERVFVITSNFITETILVPPAGVNLNPSDHLLRKVTHIQDEVECLRCTQLKMICFRANFPHGDFVAALPNVCNVT